MLCVTWATKPLPWPARRPRGLRQADRRPRRPSTCPSSDRNKSVKIRFDAKTVAEIRREEFFGGLVNAIMRNGTVGSGADYSAEFSVEVDGRSMN